MIKQQVKLSIEISSSNVRMLMNNYHQLSREKIELNSKHSEKKVKIVLKFEMTHLFLARTWHR